MKKTLVLMILVTIIACGNEVNTKSTSEKSKKRSVEIANIPQGIEIGNKIIDFDFYDLEQNKYNIKEFQGKVIFLNFWATWCPPCREEMPSMQKLYNKYKDKNFKIIAISIDNAPIDDVKKFVNNGNYDFMTAYDLKKDLGQKFLIRSIPTTFLIDQKGVIREKILGGRDWSTLDVDMLISKWE